MTFDTFISGNLTLKLIIVHPRSIEVHCRTKRADISCVFSWFTSKTLLWWHAGAETTYTNQRRDSVKARAVCAAAVSANQNWRHYGKGRHTNVSINLPFLVKFYKIDYLILKPNRITQCNSKNLKHRRSWDALCFHLPLHRVFSFQEFELVHFASISEILQGWGNKKVCSTYVPTNNLRIYGKWTTMKDAVKTSLKKWIYILSNFIASF